ncbi:hypothetical protein [Ralstonia phage RP13]|nr:hypothetical protein [Ralstonia phage RP13]
MSTPIHLRFEQEIKKYKSDADLTHENGKYVNEVTQAMWMGWLLCHRDAAYQGIARGHFIIGRIRERGIPSFAEKPYIHKTREIANTEANRLKDKYPGSRFGIYRFVRSVYREPDIKEQEVTVDADRELVS